MASTQEVLDALEICEDMGVRCIYEVDQKCPYHDENYKHVCKRSQLMKDARSKIVELQNALVESENRLQQVREAVCGPLDDEYCSYECDV